MCHFHYSFYDKLLSSADFQQGITLISHKVEDNMTWARTVCCIFLIVVTVNSNEINEESIKAFKPPESFRTRYPHYLSGYDREGSPIFVIEAGKWDYRKAIEDGDEELLDKHTTQVFLKWREVGNATEDSPGSLVIFDVDGFGIRQAGHPRVARFLLRQFVKLEAINRKPGLKHIHAINVNFLAQRIYDLGKSLLAGLNNKIDVFGTNPDKWKPVLLREVDRDQIPEWYGGIPDHQVLEVYP